ncbi:hypothetical protein [Actinomyces trachealis]|uniref:hypothetical protein n=1 Tax=Actinomyces trachealis TaxID=2763540 RepID=UPI0018C6614C|nr:hypothetical protein [Actinomyces trachealis]
MSAYVVDIEMIHALIQSAENFASCFNHFTLGGERGDVSYYLDEFGQMLLDANYASVNARYGEDTEVPTYRFKRPRYAFWPPVAVLKALDGYEYQACEAEGWLDSDARRFCDELRRLAIHYLPGYEEADWEITDCSVPRLG